MGRGNEEATKAALRKALNERRNSLSAGERKRWSIEACGHAAAYIEKHGMTSIMAYASFRSELDLSSLIEWCWDREVSVILPRSDAASYRMSMHRLQSWEELEKGAYGILEPNPFLCPELDRDVRPDMVIVPGLAFDLLGGRLGYGGGFYDRFAAECGSGSRWLGASFEAQLVPSVQLEPHDLILDGLFTQRACYQFGGGDLRWGR
ncbi:5-formyltetrahydrofolate cyclo-ligase [Paenibacillus sp. HB172176]|uniref:5-formyltetrahydrofolate cyclo-ligase n=1 Tax=Paenibacillus sp. HB172176 TaxID=2493690 RepID=UPI00143A276D|nr:5-formyltetrahydrofolate cyclo-ligase [Paenibacillus sp. HB172176]